MTIESLPLKEFLTKMNNGTLPSISKEELKIFDNLPSRKEKHFGTYRKIENFEKIYNSYIRGKAYLPACGKGKNGRFYGFIINRDGEIDMVRIKENVVLSYLKQEK